MVYFSHCTHVVITNVTLQNSPSYHFVPFFCEDVVADHINIQAPSTSPNTDGIDPICSHDVMISNCNISVGDDDISLKTDGVVDPDATLVVVLWTRGATKADFPATNLFARRHGGISSFSRTSTSTTTRTSPLTSEFWLNRSGRAYLRSSDQAALDQPIGYQLFPMQVGSVNRRKNGCDQSDCQGWRERQSSRR
jgi:hypothetical protein